MNNARRFFSLPLLLIFQSKSIWFFVITTILQVCKLNHFLESGERFSRVTSQPKIIIAKFMKMSFNIFVVLSDNLYYYNIIHIKFQFYLKEWKTNLKNLEVKKKETQVEA